MEPATLATAAIATALPYLAEVGTDASQSDTNVIGRSVWEWVKGKLTSPAGKEIVQDLEKEPNEENNRKAAQAALSKVLKSDATALMDLTKLLKQVGSVSTTDGSTGQDIDFEKKLLDNEKQRKEIQKLAIDIGNANRNLGLERLKAWGTILVPIMAAVTVLGTVYLGLFQIFAKSESDEDTNWRLMIDAIDQSHDLSKRRHAITLIKPFLGSTRYRALAIGLTVDELPRLRDKGTFKELFSYAFESQSKPSSLPTFLDIARRLKEVSYELQAAADAEGIPEKKSAKIDERNVVLQEAGLLCDPIASILRGVDHSTLSQYFSSGQKAVFKVPLNDIYFEKCDFSDIDFSDVDLTNSAFDYVMLDRAVLKNANASDYLWGGNIWWTAREIDPSLLQALLARFKPYEPIASFPQASGYYRDGAVIEKSDWETNIRRLCTIAHLSCSDEQIRANFPKDSAATP